MHPIRQYEIPARPGGYFRPGDWDSLNPMSLSPIRLGDTYFAYYRGAADLEPNEGAGGGLYIGLMTCPASDFHPDNFVWSSTPILNGAFPQNFLPGIPSDTKWADTATIEVNGTIYFYIIARGDGQRLLRFSTTDGYNLSYDGECLWNGGNFGSNIAAMYHHNGRFYFLGGRGAADPNLGNGKRLRSSADGLTNWTGHGYCMQPSGVVGTYNEYSLVTGRGWQDDTYAYALVPGIRIQHNDWPEGIGLWRCPLSELGVQDRIWDEWPGNPVLLRGPVEGGCWQLNYLQAGNGLVGTYQQWGHHDFNNLGSPEMEQLRDQPYYGTNWYWSYKSIMYIKWANELALRDWGYDIIPNGQYRIQHVNSREYLKPITASDGSRLTTTPNKSDPDIVWDVERQVGYHRIANQSASRQIRIEGESLNADVHAHLSTGPGPTTNFAGQWHLPVVYPEAPGSAAHTVQLINRHSSLGLKPDGSGSVRQQPVLGEAESFWRFVRIL